MFHDFLELNQANSASLHSQENHRPVSCPNIQRRNASWLRTWPDMLRTFRALLFKDAHPQFHHPSPGRTVPVDGIQAKHHPQLRMRAQTGWNWGFGR